MKTTIKMLTILALALAVFGQHTTAGAGGGGEGKFKGQSADAFFSSIDPSGCIYTGVGVFAGEQVYQNPPGPGSASSWTSLYISQYDYCTDTQLLAADGFASLAPPDFQVSEKLDSAALSATVNVYDYVSDSSFNVLVDLTWRGIGPLSRQKNRSHFHSPGCIINSRFNGTFRPAEASGSVSDGAMNFIPDPSVGAGISSSKSGTVVIGCN
ncbi:MAG TPA: hypothetical protein VJ022_00030 [Anaerolineales bacterium]|nr:hypothetical protein [Anaerolineales bacterium]